MNKKFLSAILFGALMVTSTGTFVSCKDYDDDIDSINKELTDIKSQLAALQSKVDAGKWITGVSSTANGLAITMSDGQTLNITNGKDGADGAQGEAGAPGKDGKDGSVVEVKDGVLYINGTATEIKVAEKAPAAKACVKVENGVLMVLGEDGEYVASDLKVSNVTATNTNGVWTITVGEDEIVVPGSAALTSIAIQGDKDLVYTYGYFAKDVEWGFNEEEKAEAGFYSRLKEDVEVLLNPAEANGAAFTYTFRNSVKAIEDLTFFGEARPSTAVLTRAASGNGVWTLPAAVTKHDVTSISELRNELYLNFKQNDSKYYAMSLEAVDGLGNVSTRSDYEYKITLDQTSVVPTVDNMNCLVGQEYYPVVNGPVIDYKIRVYPTVANKRKAEAFGIELTADEKGFIANNESAVYNEVQFQVAYVTINGDANNKTTFIASFKDEFADSEEVRVDGMKQPLNATLRLNAAGTAPYSLKQFVMSYTYDLNDLYNKASDEVQMILDENFKPNASIELIGGESEDGENYNALNRNELLRKNIDWEYDAEKKEITVSYFVSANWVQPAAPHAYYSMTAEEWDVFSNFQLNTAYQLNVTVADDGMELAKFELPFEFSEPTEGIIEHQPGRFSKWDTIPVEWKNGKASRYEDALYVYGVMANDNSNDMYLPLYDAFDAWKPETSKRAEYEEYVDDAEYYDLFFNVDPQTLILGAYGENVNKNLTDLDYNAEYSSLKTKANNALIAEYAALSNPDNTQKEFYTPIRVDYKYYGVYPKWNTSKWTDNYDRFGNKISGETAWNSGNNLEGGDFNLVFASWLKHSELKMKDASYTTDAGTHTVFISNDDLNFTTPFGDPFYLFDGISAAGKIVERADLNINAFNEIEQHPFTTVDKLFDNANFSAKQASGQQLSIPCRIGNTVIPVVHDAETGKAELDLSVLTADDDEIRIYAIDAVAKTGDKTNGFNQAFPGGMLIVLPTSVQDGQSVIVTTTLKDNWDYKNTFDIKVKKLQ